VYGADGSYPVTLTVWNDAGQSTVRQKNYITAISPEPTIPPMLAGILASVLDMISMEASAGPTVYTQPAGTAIGLTTVGGVTSPAIDNAMRGERCT
jgi:PKD repeat protein